MVQTTEIKRAVFFDLDDTIYDQLQPFNDAIKFLEEFPEDLKYEDIFKRSRQFSDILWNQYCNDVITLEELRVNRLVLAFNEFGHELTSHQALQIQEHYESRQGHIQVIDGFLEAFHTLRENGYMVGLITNGPVEHQWKKIKSLELDKYIPEELIFVSDAVGIAKPDPNIFIHVTSTLKIKPEHCYYVGDSWRNDVVPPIKAGWNSIWFNYRQRKPETNDQPFKTIYSFKEFSI
ncbi:HAD family hydrolase [Anaerobacillus alkaliphilus]|uniref:HAD family hydrolase n=1 Tax=Anaerobacillus alkaliphilus TaxID=1548597 RepID=A0A4Q0VNY0_9BACI|nr:HAD family hydrolase [Anaerobacillus alkaliphilus]RXI97898.1 HAD family hydrolase [Anaerobacillus alkaliphilus]